MTIINDDLYFHIMFISLGIICQIITVIGVVGNTLNIIIFSKQGFSDCINISLMTLAVSDLCSLVCIMWTGLCFSPPLRDSNIPMVTTDIHLITGSWMHVVFTRTTGWITAFISFERCVCIVLPLRVKTIFTRQTHIITMVVIFVVTMTCSSLAYVSVGIGWVFHPVRNTTLLGLVYHMGSYGRKMTYSVSYAVNGVLMPVSCFLAIVVCTSILVVKLNQTAIWRISNSSGINDKTKTLNIDNKVNTKERKVARMVVLLSSIFIASFLPAVAIFISGIIDPHLSYDGLNRNMFLVTLSVSSSAEAINSSINIFVYLSMSTKFRETSKSVFRIK